VRFTWGLIAFHCGNSFHSLRNSEQFTLAGVHTGVYFAFKRVQFLVAAQIIVVLHFGLVPFSISNPRNLVIACKEYNNNDNKFFKQLNLCL